MNFLLLKGVDIENANATSSPWTVGFPALTAWLGATHALERKLRATLPEIRLTGTAVVCHRHQLHASRHEYDILLHGTRNPQYMQKDIADNKPPPFIEKGQIHLNVSLLIQVEGLDPAKHEQFLRDVKLAVNGAWRIAGGTLKNECSPILSSAVDERDDRRLLRQRMPGYAIVSRKDLMAERMAAGMDALDALLDLTAIHHRCEVAETEPDASESPQPEWVSSRAEAGWLVPIAVGYHALAPLGFVEHQRDPQTLHRFVEPVVSMGEFVMPVRAKSVEDLLWSEAYYENEGCYLCENNWDGSR